MTYLIAITIFHTALSLIAIVVGLAAMRALFVAPSSKGMEDGFIALALATSVTGFFFPFKGITPAMVTGVIALLVLAAVLLARYRFAGVALWGRIYAGGMVASLYLLMFVGVVQAFLKIPVLHQFAPTGSEPAFGATQLVVLVLFVILGWAAVRNAGRA